MLFRHKSYQQYVGIFPYWNKLPLCTAYFGVKGTLYAFVNLAALPYYKNLGVSGKDYQAWYPRDCDSQGGTCASILRSQIQSPVERWRACHRRCTESSAHRPGPWRPSSALLATRCRSSAGTRWAGPLFLALQMHHNLKYTAQEGFWKNAHKAWLPLACVVHSHACASARAVRARTPNAYTPMASEDAMEAVAAIPFPVRPP